MPTARKPEPPDQRSPSASTAFRPALTRHCHPRKRDLQPTSLKGTVLIVAKVGAGYSL